MCIQLAEFTAHPNYKAQALSISSFALAQHVPQQGKALLNASFSVVDACPATFARACIRLLLYDCILFASPHFCTQWCTPARPPCNQEPLHCLLCSSSILLVAWCLPNVIIVARVLVNFQRLQSVAGLLLPPQTSCDFPRELEGPIGSETIWCEVCSSEGPHGWGPQLEAYSKRGRQPWWAH